MAMFKRVGNDYVLEYSALNALRQGITSGITVTVSIRKDVLYWDDTPDTFSSVPEVQLVLTHVINGLYRFTSVGGAVFGIQTYEIHLTVTGNPDVNESSTFTETIEGGLSSYPEGAIQFDSTITTNTNTVLETDGVSSNKVTSETAAAILAEALGTKHILVQGSFDNVALDGFLIEGLNIDNASYDPSATAVTDTTFKNIEIEAGTFGTIRATFDKCKLPSGFSTSGFETQFFRDCYIQDRVKSGGEVQMTNCSSSQNTDNLIFDFLLDMFLYVTGHKGNIKIISMTGGTGARIHMMGGNIEIDSSNTSGDIILTGWGKLTDTSAGVTVNLDGWQDIISAPQFKKNVALPNFPIFMVDDIDHITGKTGLTVTGSVGIDGGSLTPLTNTVVEASDGYYKVNLTAAEMNGDVINLLFTATGADNRPISFPTNP